MKNQKIILLMPGSKIKNKNQSLITFRRYFFLCLITFFTFSFLVLNLGDAVAQSSDNYNLEIEDIDTSPEKNAPTPIVKKSALSHPQNQEQLTVETGLLEIFQTGPISFSSSTQLIDFGTLTPGNPVIRNLLLSVMSETNDYQIIGYENHPLRTTNNEIIPDTTCDNGACTQSEQAIWESSLTYGFGFQCLTKGVLICSSHSPVITSREDKSKNYYGQFSNFAAGEEAETIINGFRGGLNEAEINFKVNASGTQQSGIYSNTVTLIAVPNY
jgi:hypothetical protein